MRARDVIVDGRIYAIQTMSIYEGADCPKPILELKGMELDRLDDDTRLTAVDGIYNYGGIAFIKDLHRLNKKELQTVARALEFTDGALSYNTRLLIKRLK